MGTGRDSYSSIFLVLDSTTIILEHNLVIGRTIDVFTKFEPPHVIFNNVVY